MWNYCIVNMYFQSSKKDEKTGMSKCNEERTGLFGE